MSALQDLERRVAEKLASTWRSHPDFPAWVLDEEPWEPPKELLSLPADWPQFPLERWAVLPARRVTALVLADKAIDSGHFTEAGWLLQYGGKVRIS